MISFLDHQCDHRGTILFQFLQVFLELVRLGHLLIEVMRVYDEEVFIFQIGVLLIIHRKKPRVEANQSIEHMLVGRMSVNPCLRFDCRSAAI